MSLPISGAFFITYRLHQDTRGAFEQFWEMENLQACGLAFEPRNAYHSYNRTSKTLRGMHYQIRGHAQAKLVQCVSGRAFDVMVDLRVESSTFGRWHAVELTAGSGTCLYVPAGCAHGFMTLEANTTIAYLVSGTYEPKMGRVLRWNDPYVGIKWPLREPTMSEKDALAPGWEQCEF